MFAFHPMEEVYITGVKGVVQRKCVTYILKCPAEFT